MLGIDLVSPPPRTTKTIGLKIGGHSIRLIRFLDLKKAEAQARRSKELRSGIGKEIRF